MCNKQKQVRLYDQTQYLNIYPETKAFLKALKLEHYFFQISKKIFFTLTNLEEFLLKHVDACPKALKKLQYLKK